MIVKTENIGKAYQRNQRREFVLRNVGFEALAGEFVSICGPSGIGKTTLLNILAGFTEPDKGAVFIDGRNLYKDFDLRQREDLLLYKISYMMQSASLLHRLTLEENITATAGIAGIRIAQGKLENLLEELGLINVRHSFPANLSGGEYRRAMLARALIKEPELLIVDEPTANLDEESAETVRKLLKAYPGKGRTVIAATHDEKLVEGSKKIILNMTMPKKASDI